MWDNNFFTRKNRFRLTDVPIEERFPYGDSIIDYSDVYYNTEILFDDDVRVMISSFIYDEYCTRRISQVNYMIWERRFLSRLKLLGYELDLFLKSRFQSLDVGYITSTQTTTQLHSGGVDTNTLLDFEGVVDSNSNINTITTSTNYGETSTINNVDGNTNTTGVGTSQTLNNSNIMFNSSSDNDINATGVFYQNPQDGRINLNFATTSNTNHNVEDLNTTQDTENTTNIDVETTDSQTVMSNTNTDTNTTSEDNTDSVNNTITNSENINTHSTVGETNTRNEHQTVTVVENENTPYTLMRDIILNNYDDIVDFIDRRISRYFILFNTETSDYQ